MKILHISDLHFQKAKAEAYKQDEFIKAVRLSLVEETIDLCIFSGDLMCKNEGSYRESFDYLMSQLVFPLKIHKVLFACGNHDVNRALVKPMFVSYMNGLKTNEDLNRFVVDNKSEEFTDNLKHLEPYNTVIGESVKPRHKGSLFYVDEMAIDSKRIALISLNTAWLALPSAQAHGSLLFPATYVFEILKITKDYDVRIIVSHYPTEFLKDFNRIEVEDSLFRKAHCIFAGHTHRLAKSVNYHLAEGLFTCIAPSCLSVNDSQHSGYVLLDLDFESQEVEYVEAHYADGMVNIGPSGTIALPASQEKKDANDIRKALMSKYRSMLDFATKKFILYEKEGIDFQTLFTEPALKYHDKVRDITDVKKDQSATKDGRWIPFRDLLSGSNFVIWGADKSGKTAILLKLFLDCLREFNSMQYVPLFFDMKTYYKTVTMERKLSLKQMLHEEYDLSNRLSEYILGKHKLLILLDNYDFAQEGANSKLLDVIVEHKNFILILTSYKAIEISPTPTMLSVPCEEVHIHGINRRQMRSLAEKWPIAKSVNRDEIVKKIAMIFTQLNIGCNYWTVSLFLWIFDRTSDINIQNNVELIDLYIENLLEKPNLALRLSKDFSYENYKDFLAYLAFYLYSENEKTEYAVRYSKLVECFERFKSRNIRVVAESKSILDYIIERGVICSIGEGLYTFRLNGVFEYFLAHYMRLDVDFKRRIIDTGTLFLAFANELEMYSGFKRNDEEVLSAIYINALSAVDRYFKKYPTYKDISPELGNKPKLLSELTNMVEKNAEKIVPLAADEKDNIGDQVQPISEIESAVKVKVKYSLENISTEILSKHVFILGRVFRGMDSLSDEKLINDVFDFVVDQGCLIFFFAMKDAKAELAADSEVSAFLEFLEDFSPIISHSFVYDAMGHRNLSNLIRKKIDDLGKKEEPNLYKLFVLYFMLVECNLQDSLKLIDEMITLAGKNEFILESIMLKLIYYIVFMCDSKPLEQELRSRVVSINKKVGRRDLAGNINQVIDKAKSGQRARNECT